MGAVEQLVPLTDAVFAAKCDYWWALRRIMRGKCAPRDGVGTGSLIPGTSPGC